MQALESGPLKEAGDAITAKDESKFDKAYRFTLQGCYAYHKASDKPFIRPQVPGEVDGNIINFDPNAMWPK